MEFQTKIGQTRDQLRNLNKAIPDTVRAFGGLSKTVKVDGALSFKTKELIALGIAVATKCEACITLHVEALINQGATREEVAEAMAMCIQMGGGPSMMYAAKALACFDELSQID